MCLRHILRIVRSHDGNVAGSGACLEVSATRTADRHSSRGNMILSAGDAATAADAALGGTAAGTTAAAAAAVGSPVAPGIPACVAASSHFPCVVPSPL